MICCANFLHTKDMKSLFFPLCWGVLEACSNAWKGQPRSLTFYPLKRTNYTVSSTSTASTLYTSLSNSDARLSGQQKQGSKGDCPPSAICPTHRGRRVNRPTPYAERRCFFFFFFLYLFCFIFYLMLLSDSPWEGAGTTSTSQFCLCPEGVYLLFPCETLCILESGDYQHSAILGHEFGRTKIPKLPRRTISLKDKSLPGSPVTIITSQFWGDALTGGPIMECPGRPLAPCTTITSADNLDSCGEYPLTAKHAGIV